MCACVCVCVWCFCWSFSGQRKRRTQQQISWGILSLSLFHMGATLSEAYVVLPRMVTYKVTLHSWRQKVRKKGETRWNGVKKCEMRRKHTTKTNGKRVWRFDLLVEGVTSSRRVASGSVSWLRGEIADVDHSGEPQGKNENWTWKKEKWRSKWRSKWIENDRLFSRKLSFFSTIWPRQFREHRFSANRSGDRWCFTTLFPTAATHG